MQQPDPTTRYEHDRDTGATHDFKFTSRFVQGASAIVSDGVWRKADELAEKLKWRTQQ